MRNKFYMLVRKGRVQRIMVNINNSEVEVKAWPVAETLDDANKLSRYLGMWSKGVRGSLVGSAPGETLEQQLELAIEDGCVFVVCIAEWNPDGSPRWKYIKLEC